MGMGKVQPVVPTSTIALAPLQAIALQRRQRPPRRAQYCFQRLAVAALGRIVQGVSRRFGCREELLLADRGRLLRQCADGQ
jgi:hypothetical protein